jgi:hypothetical protein
VHSIVIGQQHYFDLGRRVTDFSVVLKPLLHLYSQGKRARDRRCIEEPPIYDTSSCLQPLSNNIMRMGDGAVRLSGEPEEVQKIA